MSSVTQAEVADALGCSLPTYITKERNPERFTLAEFAIVFSMLSVLGRTNLKTIIDSIFSDTPDPRDFTGGDGS
jgi:DNA-binding XRE family transcriptional regulator